jgi:dihydroorotate dehydrogenase
MSERGMGAAVGQVPEYIQMVTAWCKHYSRLPVIVKLTPNIADIRQPSQAAKRGGGGGGTVIIQAVDAESVQRLMEGRGGRAAVNAVRLGRGGFSQLIRGRG